MRVPNSIRISGAARAQFIVETYLGWNRSTTMCEGRPSEVRRKRAESGGLEFGLLLSLIGTPTYSPKAIGGPGVTIPTIG